MSTCSSINNNNNISVYSFSTTSHPFRVWDIFKRVNFGTYNVLSNVGNVSPSLPAPSTVCCPPHATTGQPPTQADLPPSPEVKEERQIQAMRTVCHLAAQIQAMVAQNIKVGMTTDEIDVLVHEAAVDRRCYPSPLNYMGFPKSVCTSVNNVACHGIPDDRPLLDGDIVSVDVTVYYEGYHGDCCVTYMLGDVDAAGQHLVQAALRCRDEAIAICGPGVPFAAIGFKVEEVAEEEGVSVVPCFSGHGIGEYFHGPPDIYHCYNDYPGTMQEGMTFTIEPVISQGKGEVVILEDGWTAMTLDNGRAAQFEHTVLITNHRLYQTDSSVLGEVMRLELLPLILKIQVTDNYNIQHTGTSKCCCYKTGCVVKLL
ncbi:hypothetical protein Pmani_026842 [Petrolisthes manimaculis]|uniref:Methionine aminopeptidase n=1 Tax=Petrolisthes manimaculis TaxID=1843537 RepID=A0AAE1P4D8_9EUCA|nr:hypothetical protein Pmani_026842 [Petrolisthes manimaculis]